MTTFACAENLAIYDGTFNWHTADSHGARRPEEEREDMKQLYNHASPDAFHCARERSREVDNQWLVEVVRRWKPYLQDRSSFAAEDVLRDIFTWVCDPLITRFPSMWVNGNNGGQTAPIAQAVAGVLSQRGELSAAFFFPQETGSSQRIAASVIPSIAYQLAQNVVPARTYILDAMRNDPGIFDPRLGVQEQMKRLITEPLRKASESHEIPHSPLILIHALENCEDNFQGSLLDAFSQAQELLEPKLPLKLLVLGQHTTRLNNCFETFAGRSMVLRRPIDSGHWFLVEEEINRKEIALRKWEEELEQRQKQVEKVEENRLDQRGPSPYYHPTSAHHKSAGTSYLYQRNSLRNNRPSVALSLTTTLSRQSDISSHAGNSNSIPPTVPVASRSATIDGSPSDTQSPITQQFGPLSPSSFNSSGSSNAGDGESYYVSSAIQAAIENPEFTWISDDDGVVVAGTLEGLVQFLVTTIDSRNHKDFRDIFSMACAEVATPDNLFQIITRRLNDASAGAQFERNAFLVIEHWLELGYVPLNQNLRRTVKFLCEHAIQSKSEAARVYGFTNLEQLVDQIMEQPAPDLIGPGGIPPTRLEPRSLALALSLLEGEHYQTLRPLDYVLHLTKNMSENVKKFYEMNDKIKLWVIDTILLCDEVRRRAEVMTDFIKTAHECREMGNISSVIAITSALYSAAIRTLTLTTHSLTRDKQEKLGVLFKIINPEFNYRAYWDTLKSAPTTKKGICIPWLEVHLIELQKALSEHPVTIQEEGQHLINLKRYTAFMTRSTGLLHYTPPSGGDHNQREKLEGLLAQLRTITYPQGTNERLSARSAILQGQEELNHRSRREQMLQLGF